MSSESFHEQGLQGQGQSSFLVCVFLPQNRGKCCPFFKKDFLGPFDLWNFSFKKLGSNRCFPKLSMNRGFKDRLRICVIYLCFFAFKTGGNAARFSKTFFGPFRSLKLLLLKIGSSTNKGFKDRLRVFYFCLCFLPQNRGKCCPFFKKTTFGVHLIFESFLSKHLGPSDVFRGFPWTRASRTGSEFVLFVFVFALKQGEMLPVFQKHFLALSIFENLHLKIGSSMNKGFKDRVRVLFLSLFLPQNRGKCCPFFKKDFWVHSIFEMFPLKNLGPSDVFRIFPWTRASKDRLRICVIYLCFLLLKQGKCCPFFKKTFLGPFDLWNFYFENWVLFKNRLRVFVFVFAFTSKQGEMLPVFQKRLLGSIRSLKFAL